MLNHLSWRALFLITIVTMFFARTTTATPYFPQMDALGALFKRQDTATPGTGTISRPTTPTTVSTVSTTSASTTSKETTVTTPSTITPTTTPPATTPTPVTTPSSAIPSTTADDTPTSAPSAAASTTPSATPKEVTSTIILISTDSAGQLTTMSSVVSITIAAPSTSSSPGLVNGGSGTSSGSSSHTGAIVGGVVGGLAGLALLAAIIFYVMRSLRKRRQSNNDLDYDVGTGQGLGSSGADKQTLASDEAHADRYAPNTGVNF